MKLAIGEISYTNILPLYYFLKREELEEKGCSFVPQIPAQLNKSMKEGSVHVGGISSFAYGQNPELYDLLPDLSVSAKGNVGSIFLFSKKPITELSHSDIALTNSSATSVHLLKVILKEFYKHENITYNLMEPNGAEMLRDHDACLLIGDDAIFKSWEKSSGLYVYDIGGLWYENTGLPMTFAVIAVRKDIARKENQLLEELYKDLQRSKQLSIQTNFQTMIQEIIHKHGGRKEFWDHYFSRLVYDFTEKEKEGLLYYYHLVYKHRFIEQPVKQLSMWKKGLESQTII